MKQIKRLLSAALLLAVTCPAVAQSNNNQDEVVTIDRHNHRAYREGEVLVKFKNRSDVVQTPTRSADAGGATGVLSALGATELEPLMPLTGEAQAPKTTRAISGKAILEIDLSTLYRVRFDAAKIASVQAAIESIKSLDEVEFAEPNYIVYTLADEGTSITDCDHYKAEPLYNEQWGHGQLKLPFLWKQPKLSDKRPVIAILDTGVDITHPDLVDNIWTNTLEAEGEEEADDDANGFADDLHGWDFVNQTGRIGDWNGHGTHCAGIAAAVGKNGIGIAGANPDALIMPITVMQSDGTGDVATIIKGIDYAVANGADVLSMSFGGYNYSMAEEQALAKAYQKAVLVAAAGNDCTPINPGIRCDVCKKLGAPMFPAAFTFVLGVESAQKDGSRSVFSNYDDDGPTFSSFGEEKLYNYELRAPGGAIMSTYPGGKYKELNGTSMACPFVAGGISRLLQSKEYSSWEVLFGDLIHTRKQNGYGCVDFEAAYRLTDADRIPELGLVTYALKDTIVGDADGRPDAGETIALYPTLRNEWGQAKNIRFSLEVGENEDPTIVEILDESVDFGKSLSSYAKNISANPVRFKVNDDCADGRKIRLVLKATCDNIANEMAHEFIITVENGVEIGGLITENTTLYPGVHYIVTKTLAVPEGVTLTIKPGTVLKFKGGVSVNIPKGSLHCVGTPDSMIVFKMAEHETGYVQTLELNFNTCEYVLFDGLRFSGTTSHISEAYLKNCVIKDLISGFHFMSSVHVEYCNIIDNIGDQIFALDAKECNIVNNRYLGTYKGINSSAHDIFDFNTSIPTSDGVLNSNLIGNYVECSDKEIIHAELMMKSDNPYIYTPESPNYFGTANISGVEQRIIDMDNPVYPFEFGIYDLSNMLTRPSAEAHGIVWKVVVNGYDAQDEFEMLPPLGVGKHKFEVYFNRPMDVSVAPMIAMGVRPPYTQHAIAEEGSWSADSLIYTAYLTITGKTDADGLNRIYVADARDNEYFDIPIEDMRFNVQVAAAGSMATGLMAEAGLGKVALTWETDEEDFEDLLGYNIYRYTDKLDTVYVEYDEVGNWVGQWKVVGNTTIVNPTVIAPEDTSFVDYDVVPGTTYYYVIKQLTTSLSSHALSNAVAATPLTAQKGDANGSMAVDVADVVSEIGYMTNQDPQPFIFEAADVNSDLSVNILDVVGTLNIILTPSSTGIASVNNTATYTVEEGILYVESPVALGGVQVRIAAPKGTEFTALEGLNGFEQTGNWQSDEEYLFLAYSMVGRTIGTGKQPLLRIGDDVTISQVVLSDARGKNVLAIDGNTTGLGAAEAMQMNLPYPNPFTSQLTIPYKIGKEGEHRVTITVCDLTGRTVYRYNETCTFGEYTHTWRPEGNLADGLYMVSLHVDGTLMQTAKVVKN